MRTTTFAAIVTLVTCCSAVSIAAEQEFLPLFDGKTLQGWETADPSWWTVEDGAITGTITKENPCTKNQYLFSEVGEMGDFELKLLHRIDSPHNINCGFQFRSEHYEDADCKGYQIDNNLPDMIRIYDEFGRHTLAHRGERAVFNEKGERSVTPIQDATGEPWFDLTKWHEYHLICRGNTITLNVNGRTLGEVIDADPNNRDLSGLLAMQLHSGPPMKVQFKDIRWRPIPSATDKTLVAWVALEDLAMRGGSVLTIQCEERFDGIVFGELERGKWMAGSNNLRRTERNQTARPAETADPGTMVQMAIVYRGNEILIHRNGQLQAAYEAQNIDLLSPEYNFAVFGLRHVGAAAGGRIVGSIEDARIYDRALTSDEIQSLRPNEASEIDPYAWWDFEGDQATDRAGRFAGAAMDGGAKLDDGRLVLTEKSILIAADTEENAAAAIKGRMPGPPYVTETPAMPAEVPETWLTYHLAHPGPGVGMPGDPNCCFFYKGRYHLHYIYRNQHGFAFAHVSSSDMVKWKWHPTVLVGPNTGHGMFSGTGFFTKDGTPAIIYHGQGSGRNYITYAEDDNLDQWSEPFAVEPKTETGADAEMRHWDPDCWRNGDTFYGISGGAPPQLIKSADLQSWAPLGLLLHEDMPDLGVSRDEDVSCANMFKLGDKWMLLCISHGLGCRYYLGDFKDEKYLPEFHAMMNWKDWNFFAPESLLTEDGRRVMWAWCRLENGGAQTAIQSLPRELSLPDDGVLRIEPLRELQTLRSNEQRLGEIVVPSDSVRALDGVFGDAMELNVHFQATDAEEYGVRVFCDADGAGFSIAYHPADGVLRMGDIAPPLKLEDGEDLELRIFLDKNMVEVFANDRQAAVYMVPHDAGNSGVSLFSNGGEAKATVLRWKMGTIY